VHERATSGGSTVREAVRALVGERRHDDAWTLLRPLLLVDEDGSAGAWNLWRTLVRRGEADGWAPPAARQIRLALLCSYEGAELAAHLQLACQAQRIDATVYAAPFGQLEQELLDPSSGLAGFEPTHVLIAASTADLDFPELADDGAELLAREERRWRQLWDAIGSKFGARAVQHTFVVPDESPFGHLALRLPGSRTTLVRELNSRLGAAAGAGVLLVDSDRLAARLGKQRWFDPRLWYAMRQPFAHGALPLLARETAAVLAGDVGLGARCLVLDLDNTLWGGLVGEEGPLAITVGQGPEGEAYAAFQQYLRDLGRRGLLLAVASKNDAEAARAPFLQNPAMRLALDDFSVFVADWRRKPEQLAEIAGTLGLGLDALVFADDNPAECAEVAAALPAVDTILLDVPASELVRTVAGSLRFELSALTAEDVARRASYTGRAAAEEMRGAAGSLEQFWRSLEMHARVRDIDERSVERAAQLTQKTNQFNLTLLRRTVEEVSLLAAEPNAICKTLELDDRFAEHGIVGLVLARPAADEPATIELDTLLLSCRVIGRTAERHLLSHVSRIAHGRGCTRLRGSYVPGPRNKLVADLYSRLGFKPVPGHDHIWDYDLATQGPLVSDFIEDRP
jgi:FkbH-like protein